MIFYQLFSGGDRNYGYLVGCDKTKKSVVIDPSPDPQPCYEKARELDLEVIYVINTHIHSDHTGGNRVFMEQGAKLVTQASAQRGDIRVTDGQQLEVGNLSLSFIHTPGHTNESMCILAGQELMTGDTLFVGKVGGTGSHESAEKEFESLRKLMKLPGETRIWPGHNYGVQPCSTISHELQSNPFILRLHDFQEFLWLKDNWPAFKQEHGIK